MYYKRGSSIEARKRINRIKSDPALMDKITNQWIKSALRWRVYSGKYTVCIPASFMRTCTNNPCCVNIKATTRRQLELTFLGEDPRLDIDKAAEGFSIANRIATLSRVGSAHKGGTVVFSIGGIIRTLMISYMVGEYIWAEPTEDSNTYIISLYKEEKWEK